MNDQEYKKLIKQKLNTMDVVALFRKFPIDTSEYVLITIGNMESIKKYLPTSDGQAVSMKLGKQALWVLHDGNTDSALFFRSVKERQGFDDIKPEDIDTVNYICNL